MNRSYSKIRHIQESNIILEKKYLIEEGFGPTANPIQKGQKVLIYADKNLQKKMGYVVIDNITEDIQNGSAEFNVTMTEDFNLRLWGTFLRDLTNVLNSTKSNNGNDENFQNKKRFTIQFFCNKKGLRIKEFPNVIYSPDISNYYSRKICKTNVYSPTSNNESYHYNLNGQTIGPLKRDDMNKEIKSGKLNKETLVWKTGLNNWEKLGNFLEFKELIPSQNTPPPIPK
jgi:hypothetical protein